MFAHDGERAATRIRYEPSDTLVCNFLRALIAGDCEQTIGPRRHKHRSFAHGVLPSPDILASESTKKDPSLVQTLIQRVLESQDPAADGRHNRFCSVAHSELLMDTQNMSLGRPLTDEK
jgi:hypothetical protein